MPTKSFYCTLVDKREVDLSTNQGVDAYLTQNNYDPFSKQLNHVIKRYNNYRLQDPPQDDLEKIVMTSIVMYRMIFDNASKDLIENLPKEEIETWIDFTILILREEILSNDTIECKPNGRLFKITYWLLIALITTLKYKICLLVAIEKKLLPLIVDFVAAHKAPDMPTDHCADFINYIFINYVVCLKTIYPEWTVEKIMKKAEGFGFLAQYIRCSTCPNMKMATSIEKPVAESKSRVYEWLMNCPILIRKKFQKGQPCGDIIHGILNGTDGHQTTTNGVILSHIRNIATLSEGIKLGIKSDPEQRNGDKVMYKCQKCNATGEDFKICSICKMVHYCSKECQTKDWKLHKKTCKPMSKLEKSNIKSGSALTHNFFNKNGFIVGHRYFMKMRETGLPCEELLLDLDFVPKFDGNLAPALRDPPEFKVVIARQSYEGDRPDEPDWLKSLKGTEDYQPNVDMFVASMKDIYERVSPGDTVVFAKHPAGPSYTRMKFEDIKRLMVQQGLANGYGNMRIQEVKTKK